MEINKIGSGQIWKVPDNELDISGNWHYKIVLGCYEQNGCSQVQVMSVTSMYKKEVTMEVPILLNNQVAFIVVENIYSLPFKLFQKDENYEPIRYGTISDERFISSSEFLMMLHYLHAVCNFKWLSYDMCYNTIRKFDDYCIHFYEKYKDRDEYRKTSKYEIFSSTRYQYKRCSFVEEILTSIEMKKGNITKVKEDEDIVKENPSKKKKSGGRKKEVHFPENWETLMKEYNQFRCGKKYILSQTNLTEAEYKRCITESEKNGFITEKRKKIGKLFLGNDNPYSVLYRAGFVHITDELLAKFDKVNHSTKELKKYFDFFGNQIEFKDSDTSVKQAVVSDDLTKAVKIIETAGDFRKWKKLHAEACLLLINSDLTADVVVKSGLTHHSYQWWWSKIFSLRKVKGRRLDKINTLVSSSDSQKGGITKEDKEIIKTLDESKSPRYWSTYVLNEAKRILTSYSKEDFIGVSKKWNNEDKYNSLSSFLGLK